MKGDGNKLVGIGKTLGDIDNRIKAFSETLNGEVFLRAKTTQSMVEEYSYRTGGYEAVERTNHLFGTSNYDAQYSIIEEGRKADAEEFAEIAMKDGSFDFMGNTDFIELCDRKNQYHTAARDAYNETVFTDYDEKNTETRHHNAVSESWRPMYFIIAKFEADVKQAIAENLSVEKFEGLKAVIQKYPGTMKYVLLEAVKTPELLNKLLQEYGKDIPQSIQEDLTKAIVNSRDEKVFGVLLDNKVQSAMMHAFSLAIETQNKGNIEYVLGKYGSDLSDENKLALMNKVLDTKPINQEVFKILSQAQFPIAGRYMDAFLETAGKLLTGGINLANHIELVNLVEGFNFTIDFKNGLFTKLAQQEKPNIFSIDYLINEGASPEAAAKAFINKPAALAHVLQKYEVDTYVKQDLLQRAIYANNKDSVDAVVKAGVNIGYNNMRAAVSKKDIDIGVLKVLLQNGAPTKDARGNNILDGLESHPQKDNITRLVAGHEALRNGFEAVKQELLKKDEFKDMNQKELMDIIRVAMLEEGGPVREYFDKFGNDPVAKEEFVNEISLTYWEEFKIWCESIFSDKSQQQLRSELITPQLDELFKEAIFNAVNQEIRTEIPTQNRDAVNQLTTKREGVQANEEPKNKTFVERIQEERAARGKGQDQDGGVGRS